MRRELDMRLGPAKVGELTLEWTPLPSGDFRATTRTVIALKRPLGDDSVLRLESEEHEEYDAELRLVRSLDVSRENGIEEREELTVSGGELRVTSRKPSHQEDKTLKLPEDFSNSMREFAALREAALGGAALPLERRYSGFDTDDMAFNPKRLRLVSRTRVAGPDGPSASTIDGWTIELLDVNSGDVVHGVSDDAGLPLSGKMGVMSLALRGAASGGEPMAVLDSNLPVEGRFDPAATELRVEVIVQGDGATEPGVFVESPYQSVARHGDAYSLTLHPRRASPGLKAPSLPLTSPGQGFPAEVARFLAPTATSQSDAPEIVALARKLVGKERRSDRAAHAIVMWVFRNLDKREGTRGAASAVETLASRAGDCTEHAALVVALARAAGIPARNANGIVLLPGPRASAGYHAWPELWIGEWVAMDASSGTLDVGPTYLWLGYSEPGEPSKGSRLTRLVGRTKLVLP
jgi:hypothetical protein